MPFGRVCILMCVLSALFHFGVEAFHHRPSVWFEHPLLKIQTERLGLYFGMFLLGAAYQRRQSLKPPNGDHTGKRWIAVCLVVLVAFSLIWPLAQFAVLFLLTFLLSNGAVHMARKI